jgi:uncharacterized membrane protein YfcA
LPAARFYYDGSRVTDTGFTAQAAADAVSIMNELANLPAYSIWLISVVFFLLALAYSSVGLGGGSAYTASMVVLGFSSLAIPFISLTLNLLVTTIGSYHFIKNRHAKLTLILPFLLTSIPMAYLGGTLQLAQEVFQWILFVSLLFAVIRIYFWRNTSLQLGLSTRAKLMLSLIVGSILGLIAGIVGIGGGIYLVPLILVLGLGSAHQAAACGAIFIWMNSLAGLTARLQYNYIDLTPFIPLLIAVIAGGALGSYLGSARLSAKTVEKVLGLIVTTAVFLLGNKLITG